MQTISHVKKLFLLLILFSLTPVHLFAQSPPNPYMHRPLFCLDRLEEVQSALAADDYDLAHRTFNTAQSICEDEYEVLAINLDDTEVASHLLEQEMARVEIAAALSYCQTGSRLIERILSTHQIPESASHETVQLYQSAALCQTDRITLFPGASSLSLSGTALGTVPAGLMDSSCTGSLPAEPSAEFNIMEEMFLSVMANAPVGGDLVLAISGPSGSSEVLCNDDFDGLNPGINTYLQPGSYQAYVGEYSNGVNGTEYSLLFSTDPEALFSTSYPTFGTFNPEYHGSEQLYGNISSSISAEELFAAEGCTGYINPTHDFTLILDEESEIFIRLDPTSPSHDWGFIIHSLDEFTCHDNSEGDGPDFSDTLEAGTYLIWVTSEDTGNLQEYALTVSPYDFNLTVSDTPLYGEVTLNVEDPLDSSLKGEIDSFYSASQFFGEHCYGMVDIHPSHQLNMERAQGVEIVSRPHGTEILDAVDLVMVITGPGDFLYCNDDHEGLNPGYSGWLEEGEYQVFVGPLYSEQHESAEYSTHFISMNVDEPVMLDEMLLGSNGHFQFEGYTQVFSGVSGGSLEAVSIGNECSGYIDENGPNFTLDVTYEFEGMVEVMSPGDTTLVLSGPTGIHCNDDYRGLNPIIHNTFIPGRYGVWVGSYSEGLNHNFMVTFEEAFEDFHY